MGVLAEVEAHSCLGAAEGAHDACWRLVGAALAHRADGIGVVPVCFVPQRLRIGEPSWLEQAPAAE